MKKILVIPDSHSHYEYSNERMLRLGRFILNERPDTVVHLGDMQDYPSMSSYDAGTRRAWGRTYQRDNEHAIDHQEKLWHATDEYNSMRARNKKKQYNPLKVFCTGNHEDRADRFVNMYGNMEGFIDWRRDMQIDRFWDVVVPFKREIILDGFSFSHYFPTGITGAPIGGVSIARSMAVKLKRSAVQGHSHLFDAFVESRGEHLPKIYTFSAGCYVDPATREGWNDNTVDFWESGVLVLEEVEDGVPRGGFRWVPYDYLLRYYS